MTQLATDNNHQQFYREAAARIECDGTSWCGTTRLAIRFALLDLLSDGRPIHVIVRYESGNQHHGDGDGMAYAEGTIVAVESWELRFDGGLTIDLNDVTGVAF